MNTTAKGDAFEKRALVIIKNMIEDKRIAVMADAYHIYEKQSYYSYDRKGNIIFDLTIEVKPPDANKFSLIYIIECKDYKTLVSIDKLEAFCGKIEQVAPRNSKAIFITTSRFQKSARNYADTKGVMLISVSNNNEYDIILYKGAKTNGLINFFNNSEQPLDQGEKYLEKEIDTTLLNAIQNIRTTTNVINTFSKEDIELIANEVLNQIDENILAGGTVLTIDNLVSYTNKILGLKIRNTDSNKIFGCFDAQKGTIQVNHNLYASKRYKFVLAHEIGHCVIHDEAIIDSEILNVMPDSEYNFKTNRYNIQNDKNWIEWQANYFAVCLTMPKGPFIAMLLQYQRRFDIREGRIYLDDQLDNIRSFVKIINSMSIRLELSKTCIINRLKELDMIKDKSRTKSIGQVMHEYQDQLII